MKIDTVVMKSFFTAALVAAAQNWSNTSSEDSILGNDEQGTSNDAFVADRMADEELDADKAEQDANAAQLNTIRAMQSANRIDGMVDTVTDFANNIIRRAKVLNERIVSNPLKKAKNAFRRALTRKDDANKRLQILFEAIKNAESVGNAKTGETTEAHVRKVFIVVQLSTTIAVLAMAEEAKNQSGGSNEIKRFNAAIESFGETLCNFIPLKPCYRLQKAELLQQSADKVYEMANELKQETIIFGVKISCIAEGIRKAVHVILQDVEAEAFLQDENAIELINSFTSAKNAFDLKLQNAKQIGEDIISLINNAHLDPATESSKITTASCNFKKIEENIGKLKRIRKKMKKTFNEIATMVAEMEEAMTEFKKSKASEETAFDILEQRIDLDAWVVQKMICRRAMQKMVKKVDGLEEDTKNLKKIIADATRLSKNS